MAVRIEKVADPRDWKDRAAGWAKWKVRIPRCQECGRKNTFIALWCTRAQAEEFASKVKNHCCDRCS